MLDPTQHLYYKDKDGAYVSLSRLRELLLAEEPIFENETAGYNGGGFDKDGNRNYMTKNCFRFARPTLAKEGVDGRTEHVAIYRNLFLKGYHRKVSRHRKKEFVYNDIAFWKI